MRSKTTAVVLLIIAVTLNGCLSNFHYQSDAPRKAYFRLRRFYEEKYGGHDNGLSLAIRIQKNVYFNGDTILVMFDLLNTSDREWLVKSPKKFGDDYRKGDIRLYIKAPPAAHLPKWIADPVDLPPLPDNTYFRSIDLQQSISFSAEINFYLQRFLISNDASTVSMMTPGEYEIFATYENFDFIPSLGDTADVTMWMGRVRSNTLTFQIIE